MNLITEANLANRDSEICQYIFQCYKNVQHRSPFPFQHKYQYPIINELIHNQKCKIQYLRTVNTQSEMNADLWETQFFLQKLD